MKIPNFIITLSFIPVFCFSQQQFSKSDELRADQFYKSAIEHEHATEYRLAISDLRQAIKIMPKNEYVFALGNIFYNMKAYDDAIVAFEILTKSTPSYAESYYMLGWCYDCKGDTASALNYFYKCYEYDPKNERNLLGMAVQYKKRGDYIAMKGCMNKALSIKIKEEFYTTRAFAELNLGQYISAIDDCDKAIAISREHPDAFYNQGVALKAMGFYEKAAKDFDQALILDPKSTEARDQRDDCLSLLHQKK